MRHGYRALLRSGYVNTYHFDRKIFMPFRIERLFLC